MTNIQKIGSHATNISMDCNSVTAVKHHFTIVVRSDADIITTFNHGDYSSITTKAIMVINLALVTKYAREEWYIGLRNSGQVLSFDVILFP